MNSPKRKRSLFAWLPAMLVIAGTVVTAAGISLIPAAGAATDTETITITGDVGGEVSITPSCTGGALTIATLTQGMAAANVTGADCTMAVQTNAPAGAYLSVSDGRAVNTDPTFCRYNHASDATAACHAAASSHVADAAAAAAGGLNAGAGEFGVTLTSATGGSAATGITANATADPAAAAWYPVPNAAARMCDTTGTATANCAFRFGAKAKATQDSGNYSAVVRFTATTL